MVRNQNGFGVSGPISKETGLTPYLEALRYVNKGKPIPEDLSDVPSINTLKSVSDWNRANQMGDDAIRLFIDSARISGERYKLDARLVELGRQAEKVVLSAGSGNENQEKKIFSKIGEGVVQLVHRNNLGVNLSEMKAREEAAIHKAESLRDSAYGYWTKSLNLVGLGDDWLAMQMGKRTVDESQ